MLALSRIKDGQERYSSVPYVTPFIVFVLLIQLFRWLPVDAPVEGPILVLVGGAACLFCWPFEVALRPRDVVASVAVGAMVFLVWIAPDFLFPGYRNTFLFANAIVGRTHSSIAPVALSDHWVLFWRTIRATALVPVVEELFWRGWLMRWLINPNFRTIPLGTYAPLAFWLTAVLFACEHGPYWDVGLVTGVIYNSWMVRTKSLPDCIVMHAVTNGMLSAYIIAKHQWQYWL